MEEAKMAPMPPQAVLMQIGMGAMAAEALGVATRLKVADILAAGEMNIDDIADAAGAHAPSLYRILRSLAMIGVFSETTPRSFVNTDVSEALRSGVPGSMRNAIIFMTEPSHSMGWTNMLHSAKTGETAWKKTYGVEFFEWTANNPADGEIFNKAMTDMSAAAAPLVAEAYDFSGVKVLADIAGGHGILLSHILKANPHLKGILFDLDHVIAGAGELLQHEGVEDRVQTVTGDFFTEVPAADAYMMRHIIHDWDDERSVKILQSIHRAMIGNGKLLIIEMVVPEGNEPHPSKMLDLEMLTLPGGLERTAAEYGALVAQAGFRLQKIIPTRSPASIVEVVKA